MRAVDADGNVDLTPAEWEWSVEGLAPLTQVSVNADLKLDAQSARAASPYGDVEPGSLTGGPAGAPLRASARWRKSPPPLRPKAHQLTQRRPAASSTIPGPNWLSEPPLKT